MTNPEDAHQNIEKHSKIVATYGTKADSIFTGAFQIESGQKPLFVYSDLHSDSYKTNLDTEDEQLHKKFLEAFREMHKIRE